MPKLKTLTVRGYQSHVDTVFPLSPGLTVITGESGHGKTSGVIRPLKWLATGEPGGDGFLHKLTDPLTGETRSQSEQAEVIVELEDSVTIRKVRRKGKTSHSLSTIETPFEKAETPQEVKDMLGIHSHNFGDFEAMLNFAYQLDAPFLLSESPSAGAKVLGKLAGTEAVDMAIKSVSKDTYGQRQLRDKAKQDVERYTGDLLAYIFLDDAVQALKSCDDLMTIVDASDKKRTELINARALHSKHQEAITALGDRIHLLGDIDTLRAKMEALELFESRLYKLKAAYTMRDIAVQSLRELEGTLDNLKQVDEASELLNSLTASTEKLEALRKLSTQYTGYTQAISDAGEVLDKTESIEAVSDTLQLLDTNLERCARLQATKYSQDKYTQEVANFATVLEQLTTIETAHEQLAAVQILSTRMADLKGKQSEYSKAKEELTTTVGYLTYAEVELGKAEADLEQAWVETGGTCPLCEQEVLNL